MGTRVSKVGRRREAQNKGWTEADVMSLRKEAGMQLAMSWMVERMLVPSSQGREAPGRAGRGSMGVGGLRGLTCVATAGETVSSSWGRQYLGKMIVYSKDASIPQSHCHQLPQTGQLKTIQMYPLMTLEAGRRKSRCPRGYTPSEGAKGKSDPCPFPQPPPGTTGILVWRLNLSCTVVARCVRPLAGSLRAQTPA